MGADVCWPTATGVAGALTTIGALGATGALSGTAGAGSNEPADAVPQREQKLAVSGS